MINTVDFGMELGMEAGSSTAPCERAFIGAYLADGRRVLLRLGVFYCGFYVFNIEHLGRWYNETIRLQ